MLLAAVMPPMLESAARGEVAERFKVPDSKSGVGKPTVGSNPTLSANNIGNTSL